MVGKVTLASGLAGAAYGVFGGHAGFAREGAVTGAAIGLLLAAIEIFFLNGPPGAAIRRLPLWLLLLLRLLVYMTVILLCLNAVDMLVGTGSATEGAPKGLLPDLAFSLGVAVSTNLALILRRLAGPSLTALLLGRYQRAKEETRLILFLDLRNSTALAEKIGDAAFLDCLDRLIFAATEPIVAAGGEIYRYVGDEIIVTWRPRPGNPPRCAECVFEIRRAIERHSAYWLRTIGNVPSFRAGLHAGPVIPRTNWMLWQSASSRVSTS